MDGVYTVQFDPKRCLTGSTDRLLRYGFENFVYCFSELLVITCIPCARFINALFCYNVSSLLMHRLECGMFELDERLEQ